MWHIEQREYSDLVGGNLRERENMEDLEVIGCKLDV